MQKPWGKPVVLSPQPFPAVKSPFQHVYSASDFRNLTQGQIPAKGLVYAIRMILVIVFVVVRNLWNVEAR